MVLTVHPVQPCYAEVGGEVFDGRPPPAPTQCALSLTLAHYFFEVLLVPPLVSGLSSRLNEVGLRSHNHLRRDVQRVIEESRADL